ncbi:MAG: hypothetical protein AAGD92_09275 [Pseudomonadota bacterium]
MLTPFLLAVAAAQSPVPLPPQIRKPPEKTCTCSGEAEPGLRQIEGFVVDAEVTLASDGRSANDRQATIFAPGSVGNAERIRVFHFTSAKNCGVTFDYGKKYTLTVRTLEDGALETDRCLTTPAKRLTPSKSE